MKEKDHGYSQQIKLNNFDISLGTEIGDSLSNLNYQSGADPGYVKRGGRDPKGGGPGGWYNLKIAQK